MPLNTIDCKRLLMHDLQLPTFALHTSPATNLILMGALRGTFFKDGRTLIVIYRESWMTKKKVPTSSYLSMLPKQDRCTVCDLNQPFSCILARWGPQSSSWWRGARAGTVCWVAQQPEKDKDAQFQDIILSPTHYTLRTHHVHCPKRTQHKEFGPQNFGLNG